MTQQVIFDTINEPSEQLVGNLIVLNCNHNGNFSHEEKALFERHLIAAKFIDQWDLEVTSLDID